MTQHPITDVDEEDEEVDPRGRPFKNRDPLVHVFVDQYVALIPNLTI